MNTEEKKEIEQESFKKLIKENKDLKELDLVETMGHDFGKVFRMIQENDKIKKKLNLK